MQTMVHHVLVACSYVCVPILVSCPGCLAAPARPSSSAHPDPSYCHHRPFSHWVSRVVYGRPTLARPLSRRRNQRPTRYSS